MVFFFCWSWAMWCGGGNKEGERAALAPPQLSLAFWGGEAAAHFLGCRVEVFVTALPTALSGARKDASSVGLPFWRALHGALCSRSADSPSFLCPQTHAHTRKVSCVEGLSPCRPPTVGPLLSPFSLAGFPRRRVRQGKDAGMAHPFPILPLHPPTLHSHPTPRTHPTHTAAAAPITHPAPTHGH